VPPYEATLTKNLRDAGAIIIAKTGLTELANWVAGNPTPMPGNYNAVGGFGSTRTIRGSTRARPRSTAGPRCKRADRVRGIGTSANFWAGNVGKRHRRIGD
jgi:amidase